MVDADVLRKEQADTAFNVRISKLQDYQTIDNIASGFQVTRPRRRRQRQAEGIIARISHATVNERCGTHGHVDPAIYVPRRVAVADEVSLLTVDKMYNAESKPGCSQVQRHWTTCFVSN
jgi:hypothetical protein